MCSLKTKGLLVLVPLGACTVSKNTEPSFLLILEFYILNGVGPEPWEKYKVGSLWARVGRVKKHSEHLAKESEM